MISHEHEPDPRILPEDVFTKEEPRPSEDDRPDELRWEIAVFDYPGTKPDKHTFAVTTKRDLTVMDVLVEGLRANYLTAAYVVGRRQGVR